MLKCFFFVALFQMILPKELSAQNNRFVDRFLLREGERENLRTIPVFSIYKDNYLVTGFRGIRIFF